MLQIGQVVDRFTVEALLGEGGMAAVYRVRHNTLGSYHALKLLKIEGEGIRARLVLEGQVQASLRHPNIVTVTDVIFIGQQPGLVMELVEGPTLDAWLYEANATAEDAERIFRGVLSGVARAHRAGLVHRDLKPGNILLDSADGVIIPKVTDFGLTKILSDDDAAYSQTRTGTAMGTPQYMAPEQIRSSKNVDQRADIWALGCILYQIYTGRPPFVDDDIIALYASIGAGDYPPPEHVAPGIPAQVAQAIRACLTVDREARVADCEALRQLLSGAPAAEPARPMAAPQAHSTIVVPKPAQEPRRTRLGLALIAVFAGLLLVAGATGAALYLAQEPPQGGAVVEATPVVVDTVRRAPVEGAAPSEKVPTPALPTRATATSGSGSKAAATRGAASAPVAASTPVETAPSTDSPAEVAPARTGRVSVSGDVEKLVLSSGGRTHRAGEVPAGTYLATVSFVGRDPIEIGPFDVAPGDSVTIACNAAFANCNVR